FRVTGNGHFRKMTPVAAAGHDGVTQRNGRVFSQFSGFAPSLQIFHAGVLRKSECVIPYRRIKHILNTIIPNIFSPKEFEEHSLELIVFPFFLHQGMLRLQVSLQERQEHKNKRPY
ncbi:TPA: hypothetical protein QCK25_004723, partial [Enterobacter mori]|nr:hypothetical protein [Enterobacter mori]